MRRFLLLLLSSLLLAACNGDKQILRGNGEPAMPPYGYIIYCRDNPTAQECGGKP